MITRPKVASDILQGSDPLGLNIEGRAASLHRPRIRGSRAKTVMDLESMAQLLEEMLPNFKRKEERQFFGQIVKTYRLEARDILLESLSINQTESVTRRRAKNNRPVSR
jgi:hypothetical protein